MGGLASGEWMPTTFVAVAPDGAVNRLFSNFGGPLGWVGEGRGMGKDGWVGIWGVDADNFCRNCSADTAVLVSLSILEDPGMGGERGGEERRDGWVGICGVDADNFASSCSADAAVLGYLSILDAPGMGGRGQGDREGWVGWDLGSGCRQLLEQLLRRQLFSTIFRFWRPLG